MDGPKISLFTLVPLFLLHWVTSYAYNPPDNIAVNCGSSISTDQYGRNWVGDIDSKRFSTIEPQNERQSLVVKASFSPSVDNVPFGNARLFRSQFTYSFPLSTSGPKFVRLHFYPTDYDTFEAYNSLFSVTAGNFTLLKDFNASLWRSDDDETVSKEYCINVGEDERLNITFSPSNDHGHPDAYAFINGIEVVSMPPFLYYTDPSNDPGFKQIGGGSDILYQLGSERALETVYRVNVGDNQVPAGKDTGMFRYWENEIPRYFVGKQRPQSVQSGFALGLELKYENKPNYTAPEDVYLTARSCGKYDTSDYNVSWNFRVDSKFLFMVRLHFCTWSPYVQTDGDLIFEILIAEDMADSDFSLIECTGGNLVPGHKDFAVMKFNEATTSKKVDLSIKLHRLPEGVRTRISDVLLNGMEIFKISDYNSNLAGPNPDPVASPPQVFSQFKSSKSSKKTVTVVIIAVVAVSTLLLASIIVGVLVLRQRRSRTSFYKERSTKKEGLSSLPSHLCRYFTIAEIRAATNNFDDVFIVGGGGFGNVYKGYIDGGTTPVAIKRLKPGSQQGINEFLNEIDMLSQLRHLHLVSLIGYCNDGVEMILVYDFMQRGTLREYLYGSDNNPLPWKQRLEILLGAARGLHYLHAGAKHNIIHRDVKSSNILLDEKWVAKVSDFGLSKVGPTGMSTTHVSTIVKGSLGYLDPEYYKRQRLTLKSDVYSFGVVLLEVLCARPPLIRNVDKHKASLVDWVTKLNDQGKLDQTVDIFLKGSITPECLKWYGQLAMSCLHDDGNQRPSMNDVVGALEFAMQLAEGDKDNSFGGAQDKEKGEESPLIPQFTSDEGSDVLFTSDESGTKDSRVTTISGSSEERAMISGLVFSEIGDPRAR